jgi:WD40 repeat protein
MTEYQDAFISYGRADSKSFAFKLYDRLRQEGLNIWFDFADIPLGVDYQKQIDDGIETTHNFLFIISPHSVHSPYCRLEIDLALRYNKRIIPLLHVQDISYETWQNRNLGGTEAEWKQFVAEGKHSALSGMPPAISKINWIFFREDQDDFEQSIQGLLSVFQRHHAYVQAHTVYLKAALHWDRNQQNPDRLLVGESLQAALTWLKTSFATEQPPCTPSDLHCRFITQSHLADRNQRSDIYLCYADEDQNLAMLIYWELLHGGWLVWNRKLDLESSGSLQDKTFRAIEAADNFLYVFSSHSQNSKGCQKELAHAFNLEKRIIPIQVESSNGSQSVLDKVNFKATPPTRTLNRIYSRLESKETSTIVQQLKGLNFIKLFDDEGSTLSEVGLKQLSQDLQKDASFHCQQTDLLVRSLVWKSHRYNPKLLLQGYRLEQAQSWLHLAQEMKQGFCTVLQEDYIRVSSSTTPADEVEVFLLYAPVDAGFTARINQALQIQGRSTWFAADQLDPETPNTFEHRQKMLLEAVNCIAIVSPSLLQDSECQVLLQDVLSLNKRFVPVLYRSLDLSLFAPSLKDLPPNLQRILPLFEQMEHLDWIDFAHHNRDFHTAMGDLIRILDLDREYVQTHSKWGLRARQWLQAGQPDNLLLQGHELHTANAWLHLALTENRSPQVTEAQRSFIEASTEAHNRQLHLADRERQQELKRARRLAIGSAVMGLMMATMTVFSTFQLWKAEVETIETLRVSSELLFSEGKQLQALLQAVSANQRLHESLLDRLLHRFLLIQDRDLQIKVQGTLQEILLNINEVNEVAAQTMQMSASGQFLAIHQQDGRLQVWKLNGEKYLEWETDRQDVGILGISPDDRVLATAGAGGTVSLWSLETGLLLKQWSAHTKAITNLHFSPDSASLLTTGDGKAYRWDFQGKAQAVLTLSGQQIVQGVFIPAGNRIFTVTEGKQMHLWTAQGKSLGPLPARAGLSSFAFSPEGDYLLTGHENGDLQLWSVVGPTTGTRLRQQRVSEQPISTIAFSAQYTGSAFHPNLDPTPSASVAKSEGATSTGRSTSTVVATGSADGVIRLWDASFRLQRQMFAHTGSIQFLEFKQVQWGSPDQNSRITPGLVSLGEQDGILRFWSVEGWQKFQFVINHSTIKTLQMSPDHTSFVTLSQGGQARSWSLQGHQQYTLRSQSKQVNRVRYSPDGRFLATLTPEGLLEVWSLEKDSPRKLRQWDQVQEMVFSPDSNQLLWLAQDPQKGQVIEVRSLRSFQLEHGRTLTTPESSLNNLSNLQVNPQSDRIVVQSATGQVYIWNLVGEEFWSFRPHTNPLQTLTFHPVNHSLVTTDTLGEMAYWQENGTNLWRKDLRSSSDDSGIYLTKFSPDGQRLITAQWTGQVQVWDTEKGKPDLDLNQTFEENPVNGEVLSIAFEQDFHPSVQTFLPILLVKRSDSSIFVQRWRQRNSVQQIEFNVHEDGIREASFVPHTPWVQTISWGGSARLWDLEGHKLLKIENHYGQVQSSMVSPDRRWFVTAGRDGTAKIWPLQSTPKLVQESCEWLRGYLSTYPPDDPNQKLCPP